MTARVAGLAFVIAALLPAPALAQTLYKLVDKTGKVSYADRVPKGFDGEVTPITIDPATNAASPIRIAPVQRAEDAPRDRNSERRDARAKLTLALERAQAKVAAAKKALADGVDPLEDEYQTIQQKFDASGAKPDAPGPRGNCRRLSSDDGRSAWVCPTIVPGERYRDRQKALEDALRDAEAELAVAEQAYRRGTD
jgi:hypothetical protein